MPTTAPKTRTTKTQANRKRAVKEPKASRPIMPALYGMGKRKKGTLKWADATKKLEKSHNYWISTTREDGRPHAMPVWGFWVDDAVYFGTGRETVKGRNLLRSGQAIVHLESGDDAVILECRVKEVDLNEDTELRERLNKLSMAKYKMGLMLIPESAMFCARPKVALAWREKDFPESGTRWVFE